MVGFPNNHGFSLLKMISTWGCLGGTTIFQETPISQPVGMPLEIVTQTSHRHLGRFQLAGPRSRWCSGRRQAIAIAILGGGNSNIFYFHPRKLGKMIQFD